MGSSTCCARALIAKIDKPIVACVSILPIDLDAFRLGDGDMFGIGAVEHGFASMAGECRKSMQMPLHVAYA
jgi:hypothetical protein